MFSHFEGFSDSFRNCDLNPKEGTIQKKKRRSNSKLRCGCTYTGGRNLYEVVIRKKWKGNSFHT